MFRAGKKHNLVVGLLAAIFPGLPVLGIELAVGWLFGVVAYGWSMMR